jgi:hypothetical protein
MLCKARDQSTRMSDSMAKPLFETTVRPDWREIAAATVAEDARLWRRLQLAVIALTLAVLLASSLTPPGRWLILLRTFLTVSVCWGLPLWSIYRTAEDRMQAQRLMGVAAILLAGALIVAIATVPASLANQGVVGRVANSPLVIAVPLLTGLVLAQTVRRFPRRARTLGLVRRSWLRNAIMGSATGAALGFHLLITISFLPGAPEPRMPAPATLIWLVCYFGGLEALGVELLFRGLGFHLLSGALQDDAPRLVTRLTLLNLFLYLIPVSQINPALWIWGVIYGALLALAATLLRLRQGSLVPGLACNVVFSIFLAVATGI